MVSVFVSREHGIICEISYMVLDEVNEQRFGQVYADDEEASIEVHGCLKTIPLTKTMSPFLKLFEYGENGEGYWNYNRMVIQFEDAVDVLRVMHPQYDFIFLFDHSSGHAQQRPDDINPFRMNCSYGGKATHTCKQLLSNKKRDTLAASHESWSLEIHSRLSSAKQIVVRSGFRMLREMNAVMTSNSERLMM